MKDIELNTPFKNDVDTHRNNNYKNINTKRVAYPKNSITNNNDFNNNRNIYAINTLKNDLGSNIYNNNRYHQSYFRLNNNSFVEHQYNSIHYINNDFYEQLNYFLEILKPFSFNIIIFRKLSIDIPLIIYATSILLKKIFSNKLTLFYLLLLIFLPCCCHFILNKAIIEIYFNLNLLNHKKISIKNFWKIFLCGFAPYIFGYLLSISFTRFFQIIIIINILGLIYSSYIAEKIFIEFIILISLYNNKNDLKKIIIEKSGKNIFFIFIAFYFLLIYIMNL